MLIIFILSFTPGDKLPKIEWELVSIGTLAHFIMYGTLCFLMLFPFTQKKFLNLSQIRLYVVVILAGTSIGFFVELIQGNFIYRRYFDTEDIIVNGIGTVFGVLGYHLIGRKLV